jgi:hypothetical protein
MEKIIEFYKYANKQTFLFVFGEDQGPHLWNAYTNKHNRNFMKFLCLLDKENTEKLKRYLD